MNSDQTVVELIKDWIPYHGFWVLQRPAAGDIGACRTYGYQLLQRGLMLQAGFFALMITMYCYFPSGGDDYHIGATFGTLPWFFAPLIDYWEGVECLFLAGDGKGVNGQIGGLQRMGLAVAFIPLVTLCAVATHQGLTVGAEKWRAPRQLAVDQITATTTLAKGRTHWNDNVVNHRDVVVNYSKLDLSGLDLTGYNFHGAILRDTKFRGARLDDASFHLADMTGADLTGASCRNTLFAIATLDKADLSGADLTGAWVHHASLAKAKVDGATLIGLHTGGFDFSKPLAERFPKTR